MEEFKPFKVTLCKGLRFWEDESTNVMVKPGKETLISQRDFRSSELRINMMRHKILLTEGSCIFAFRGSIVKLEKGNEKNLITVLQEPVIQKSAPIVTYDTVNEYSDEEVTEAKDIPKPIEEKPVILEKPIEVVKNSKKTALTR